MSALLSHHTKNADSHRAYQELRSTFTDRDAVLRKVNYRCDGGPCSDLRFLGYY